MLNIAEPSNSKFALLELGFRPFFLGAALISSLSILGWILYYSSFINLDVAYYKAYQWHSHEMIFGYANAVIAGFLLTAVTNWTGRMTIKNVPLAVLFLIWIAARIIPFVTTNGWIIATIDLIFYPLLAFAVAVPIIKSGNKRNLFLIGIIALLGVSNLWVHLSLLDLISTNPSLGSYTGLYLELLLIIIFAGRVFPFFTGRGVKHPFEPKKYQWLEIASVLSFVLFAVADIVKMPATIILSLSIFVILVHSLRLMGWYNKQIWAVPLLWVLHLGYFFLIFGIALKGASSYFPALNFPGLHAMTTGGLGLITLGMMARVSLGHTGRSIHQPPKAVTLIFLLVVIATLVRVFVPILFIQHYTFALQISGWLWSAAFLLFFMIYLPFLCKTRVDGLPG